MSASAPSLTAGLPVAVPQIPDFSERLSPMLVKELRQGMRSPVFVWGLIVMNVFLSVNVWLTMVEPEESGLHRAFFGAFCALVCGLLPLRAAGALHDELKGNTIDTLIMTRLTGWRITLGKWVAIVAQQLLATVTVLPYLIVRYFAGGVNVPMELAWLGIFLLAGMGSAAVLTGFSWIRYFLFRAAIMMGMTFMTGGFCVVVVESMYGYRRDYLIDDLYRNGGWRWLALIAVPVVHLAFFALDVGAAKVSSMVENRSLRRRLVGLAAIGFYFLMALTWKIPGAYLGDYVQIMICSTLSFATFLGIGLQALLESPVNLVATAMPWVKRGWWGRLAGRFFYVGWPSGVLYLVTLLVLFGGGLAWCFFEANVTRRGGMGYEFRERDLASMIAGFGALLGMLPVPLVLWQLFLRQRLPWHLGIYGLILGILVALELGIIALASGLDSPNLLKLGLPIPTMSWPWLEAAHHDGTSYYRRVETMDWGYGEIALISGCVSIFWWIMALLLSRRASQETRAVEREAATLLKQPAESLPAPGNG